MSDQRIHLYIQDNAPNSEYHNFLIQLYPNPKFPDHPLNIEELNIYDISINITALVRSLAANDKYNSTSCYRTNNGKRHYDSKIKVTFGSGTHDHQSVIDPLTPIKQLCDELGIEILYVE